MLKRRRSAIVKGSANVNTILPIFVPEAFFQSILGIGVAPTMHNTRRTRKLSRIYSVEASARVVVPMPKSPPTNFGSASIDSTLNITKLISVVKST